MFDGLKEFLFGPVEPAPRVSGGTIDAAVAFVVKTVEAERARQEAAAKAEEERRRQAEKASERSAGEDASKRCHIRNDPDSCRYKSDSSVVNVPLDFGGSGGRKPNLKAAVLSFSARLLTCVREKCGGDGRTAYSRSHVSKQIYSRIVAWDDGRADKKTVMKFCLGLQLNRTEADLLMKSAGYAFSGTIPLDCAVAYAIENRIWNLDDVNEILRRASLSPLD